MFGLLNGTRETLERAAAEFDPDVLDGVEAVRVVEQLGVIRRLVDAIMAGLNKAATPVATAIATSLGNEAVRAITGH